MAFSPTRDQEKALQAALKWFHDPEKRKSPFRLFGYAGTGKTSTAKYIATTLAGKNGKVEYAAFTGKAAHVMATKGGCLGARTIHNLCFKPTGRTPPDDKHPNGFLTFSRNPSSDIRDAVLVVIDECSMVDRTLGSCLESFGVPILVLGDPAQLPPVFGLGYFTPEGVAPDVLLTEILRQEGGSAIINTATKIRMGERLPEIGDYGNGEVQIANLVEDDAVLSADQVLVGCHNARLHYNAGIRKALGFDAPFPQVGEKLVCLKNDYSRGLLNGSLWKVVATDEEEEEYLFLDVVPDEPEGSKVPVRICVAWDFKDMRDAAAFVGDDGIVDENIDPFTFGYALTVHKSQGSEWDNVLLVDERRFFKAISRQWMYTGITRASKKLTIRVPPPPTRFVIPGFTLPAPHIQQSGVNP